MENVDYRPKPRLGYGIVHEPLMVTPIESNRRAGQIVAFIGKQLCFFERDGEQPVLGIPIEVMITRPIFARYTEHDREAVPHTRDDGRVQYGINWNRLSSVLIQPVVPDDHMLIAIDGFECSGSMFTTKASGVVTDPLRGMWTDNEVWPRPRKDKIINSRIEDEPVRLSVTPGRSHVRVANNVNAGSTWKTPYQQRHPTNVYVERKIFEEKQGYCVRVAGLTRFEDCEYYRLIRR